METLSLALQFSNFAGQLIDLLFFVLNGVAQLLRGLLGALQLETQRLSIGFDLLQSLLELGSKLLNLALIGRLELVDAALLSLVGVIKLGLVILFDALQLLILGSLESDEALLDLPYALAILLMLFEELSALLLKLDIQFPLHEQFLGGPLRGFFRRRFFEFEAQVKKVTELVVLEDVAHSCLALSYQIDYASEAIEFIIAAVGDAEVKQGLGFLGQLRKLHEDVLLLP